MLRHIRIRTALILGATLVTAGPAAAQYYPAGGWYRSGPSFGFSVRAFGFHAGIGLPPGPGGYEAYYPGRPMVTVADPWGRVADVPLRPKVLYYSDQILTPTGPFYPNSIAVMPDNRRPRVVSAGPPVVTTAPRTTYTPPVIREGTPVEGTPVIREGTPVIREGTPVIREGTPVIRQGAPPPKPAPPTAAAPQSGSLPPSPPAPSRAQPLPPLPPLPPSGPPAKAMPPEPLIPKASEPDRTADVPPPPVPESPKRPDAGAVPDRPKRSDGPTVPELPRLPDVPTVPTGAKPAADKPAGEKGLNLGPAPMDAVPPPRPAK